MRPRPPAEVAINQRQFQGMRAAAVVAAVLVLISLVLWGVGLAAGFQADCPPPQGAGKARVGGLSDLDKKLSLWPPGQSCDYGGRVEAEIAQPFDWINAAIIGSLVLAAVMLLLGLTSTVRYRWLRPSGPDD